MPEFLGGFHSSRLGGLLRVFGGNDTSSKVGLILPREGVEALVGGQILGPLLISSPDAFAQSVFRLSRDAIKLLVVARM